MGFGFHTQMDSRQKNGDDQRYDTDDGQINILSLKSIRCPNGVTEDTKQQIGVRNGFDTLNLLLSWLVPYAQVGWKGCDREQNSRNLTSCRQKVQDLVSFRDSRLYHLGLRAIVLSDRLRDLLEV